MTEDMRSPEERLRAAGARHSEARQPETPDTEPPEFSDDAVALAFSLQHAGLLLYVPDWGHWLQWDGSRWARDTTLSVFDLARRICRAQSALAGASDKGSGDRVAKIASAQKVAAVEKMARSDRKHAREASLFDADPWILNTPAGVVDLRSGLTRPSQPTDLLTKLTGTAPCGACPLWQAFLLEITQDDGEVIAYLQRWAGYMLTGETREHAFLFASGPGGNGKGILMRTLAAALGDYAVTAPMETFMSTQLDRHPTDLAGLRGARMVLAQETEAGRNLAEARVKALTGGDRVSARFMRGDFFEFTPTFKLVMTGNHRPVIRNPDDAMRRRLHILPLTFKPSKPDPDLEDRLRAELPGILAWAIEGCLAWQREGLGRPGTVQEATDAYFEDQDTFAQWLAQRCQPSVMSTPSSAALFRDWKAWMDALGETAGSVKAFSAEMERHYPKKRTSTGAVFLGVRLLPSDTGVF
jgi:P4 family phage/plasmid primase-like protien